MTSTLVASPLPALADRPTEPSRDRDLFVDLARAGALAVVVLWHWVFTTIHWDGRGPHVGNPVGVTPGMWLLTWVLQPMPIFFAVGGLLHARTLRQGSTGFRRRRLRRLVLPALPLLGPALVLMIGAAAIGRTDVVAAIVLLISPLWFLAVYVVLVALAPWAWRAHRRSPWAALAGMVALAAAVDLARFAAGWEGPLATLAGFVVVWAVVHQLGFHLDDLRRAPLARRVALAAVGLALLALAVTVGPYPAAMVGVPGQRISNMAPPTFAVILLALLQIGLLTAAVGPLERFASRHEARLGQAGAWSMTVFVWHLVAWVGWYAIVRVAGGLDDSTVTGGWWLTRPLWLLGPAALALPLCHLTRRFDGGRVARDVRSA